MATLRPIQAGAVESSRRSVGIDASVFGDSTGASAVAQGISNLSRGIQSYAASDMDVRVHLKKLDDMRYMNEVQDKATRFSSEFLDDPHRAASETFHTDYEAQMKKFADTWVPAAPSKEAKIRAQDMVNQISAGGYHTAVKTVVNTKVTKTSLSIDANLDAQGNQISALLASNPDEASSAALGALTGYRDMVRDAFAVTHPVLAEKMVERGQTGLIERVMHDSPTLARQLLSASSLGNEGHAALERRIRIIEETNKVGDKIAFRDLVNRQEQAFVDGDLSSGSLIPKQEFVSLYGEKEGTAHFEVHEKKFNNLVEADNVWQKIRGRSPAFQVNEVTAFKDHHPLNHEGKQVLQHKYAAGMHLYNTDKASWLTSNNPAVDLASSRVSHLANTGAPINQVLDSIHKKTDVLLQFQGSAPEGASPEEASRYLNLPNKQILTVPEAKSMAARFNNASGVGAIENTIRELRSMYPEPERFAIVANDLQALLPEGEAPKLHIQAALVNLDQPWLPGFLSAQVNQKFNLTNLPTKTVEDIDKEMRNPEGLTSTWESGFPDQRRAFADTRESIRNYALELAQSGNGKAGMGAKEAVTAASKAVLGSTRSLVKVNGRQTVVPFTGSLNETTIPKLELLLNSIRDSIDIDQLDIPAHFPSYLYLVGEDTRKAAVQSSITKVGHWSVSSDEKSLQFRMKGDDGLAYVLTDSNGKALQWDLDDLGKIAVSGKYWMSPSEFDASGNTLFGGDYASQDIFSVGVPSAAMGLKSRTNWPFTPAKK